MKKNVWVCLIAFLLLFAFPQTANISASAETIEEQLDLETSEQIDNLDFEDIEKLFETADTGLVDVLDGVTFRGLVENIVDGKTTFSFGSFFSACWKALSSAFLSLLPFVAVLLAVVLLASIFSRIKPNLAEGQIGSIVFFATFAIVALLAAHMVASVVAETTEALSSMKKQMQTVFPILLTLMTASGGASSVKIYQPAVGILAGGVSSVFLSVLLPLFSI